MASLFQAKARKPSHSWQELQSRDRLIYHIIVDRLVCRVHTLSMTRFNSFLDAAPHLHNELCHEGNRDTDLDKLKPSSTEKLWWRCNQGHRWQAAIYNRVRGSGCPYCSGKKVDPGNSLAALYPHLAKQWGQDNTVTPEQIRPGSAKRISWICDHNHEWVAPVRNRTQAKSGCPFCSGRVATKTMNLATKYPDLALEWGKANERPADSVRPSSAYMAAWICKKGHEYRSRVSQRTLGYGCPYCSGRRASKENNLRALFPDLAKDWHPKKNALSPDEVLPFSNKKFWWKCVKCKNEWQTAVSIRHKRGCRHCAERRKKTPWPR